MDHATTDELVTALNELLEAERAGVLVTMQTARETPEALTPIIVGVQRDEAHWVGVLARAIRGLDGTPSETAGAFHEKAMAIPNLSERLTFLNRGQGWVVRKLEALLPRIGDDALRAELTAMLVSHRDNIALVASHAGG